MKKKINRSTKIIHGSSPESTGDTWLGSLLFTGAVLDIRKRIRRVRQIEQKMALS